MSAPVVPQRPARSQAPPTSSTDQDGPLVPPRPTRLSERSISPNRAAAVRSPLNDSPFVSKVPSAPPPNVSTDSLEKTTSVPSLPTIGHEGEEYASLEEISEKVEPESLQGRADAPNELSHVSNDLPLHAPVASVAPAVAKEQVEPITRTDSSQAASAGVGNLVTEYDNDPLSRQSTAAQAKDTPLSLSRTVSRAQGSRPESIHSEDHEHGIPHIGVHGPLNPNAGDAQAPLAGVSTNDGRRKSHPGIYGPPGSYGLHGHGLTPQDQFEKAWYQKHPEELSKEEKGSHGHSLNAIRPETALSIEQLNEMVSRSNKRKSVGGGAELGVPSDAIGFRMSDEVTSRENSPMLKPVHSRTHSQTYQESPLRKAMTPADFEGAATFESDNEDDNVQLGPSRHRPVVSREVSTPALASDESAKDPSGEWLEPAVTPGAEKLGDDDYFAVYASDPSQSPRAKSSPPITRRGASNDQDSLHRLEEIDEYEPLFKPEDDEEYKQKLLRKRRELEMKRFPSKDIWEDTPTSLQLETTVEDPDADDEQGSPATSRAVPAASAQEDGLSRQTTVESASFLDDEDLHAIKPKFKPGLRDETRRGGPRRFPSKDIWEDTPDSFYLQTTVDPEEDVPKPVHTTVASGPSANAASAKPTVPARPSRSKDTGATQAQPTVPPRPPQRLKQVPPAEVPPPPSKPKELSPTERRGPGLPDRPKPQVPPRPGKSSQDGYTAEAATAKSASVGSEGSIEATSTTDRSIAAPSTASKTKPAVPAKSGVGGKFASMKAGFMQDLNSRLQHGRPHKKSSTDQDQVAAAKEEEKAPLVDARKGRARGPMRRKPAEPSPSPSAEQSKAAPSDPTASWSIASPWNVWSISNTGEDSVTMGNKPSPDSLEIPKPAKPGDIPVQSSQPPTPGISADGDPLEVSPLARNTAGETTDPSALRGALPRSITTHSTEEMDVRAAAEDEAAHQKIEDLDRDQHNLAEKDLPDQAVAAMDKFISSQPASESSQTALVPDGETPATATIESVEAGK